MADTHTMGYSSNGFVGDVGEDHLANSVRRAEASDIPEIAAMCHQVEGNAQTWTPALIREHLDYFIVEGDPVHGFIRAEPFEGKLVLTLVAVKPEWHRKGVATRLLDALEDVARALGVDELVNCGPKTPEVFKLYDALGWKAAGLTPQGYQILSKEVKDVSHT